MSTSYRKTGKSLREVIKIDGKLVIRVLNKEKRSLIDVTESEYIASDVLELYTDTCTEEEFIAAFSDAISRITTQRLDI